MTLYDLLESCNLTKAKNGLYSCWCGASDSLQIKEEGTRWRCFSPKHDIYKKTDSDTTYNYGDIIDLVRQTQNLSFKDAKAWIEVNCGGDSIPIKTKSPGKPKSIEIGKYHDYINHCIEELKTNQDAREYLYSRGFTDSEIERFYLGSDSNYHNNGLYTGKQPGELNRAYIIIPFDRMGTYYQARAIKTTGEYDRMNPKGNMIIYNQSCIQDNSIIYVCEAPLDAISIMCLYPGEKAISVGGAGWYRLIEYLKEHQFKGVTFAISYDSDSEGVRMGEQLQQELISIGYGAIMCNDYQGCKDANEQLQAVRRNSHQA